MSKEKIFYPPRKKIKTAQDDKSKVDHSMIDELDNLRSFRALRHDWFLLLSNLPAVITGIQYPHVARLTGNPFTGRLSHFCDPYEIGWEIVNHAGRLAASDPRGMCHFWVALSPMLLVTDPRYLIQIFKFNSDKIDRAPFLENNLGAGVEQKTIFTSSSDTLDWKKLHAIYYDTASNRNNLDKIFDNINNIIYKYFSQIDENEEVELETFFSRLTMEIFIREILGLKENSILDKSAVFKKAIDELISAVFDHINIIEHMVATRINHIHNPLIKNIASLLVKLVGIHTDQTKIQQMRKIAHEIIRNHYLSHLETIKKTSNLTTKLAEFHADALGQEYSDAIFFTDRMLDVTILNLLVGHDASSKILQFATMLLYLYPDVHKKLRDELLSNKPIDNHWTPALVDKLKYLDNVVNEVLRKYPVPTLGYSVIKQFPLGDIPKVNSKAEYDDEMSHRDKSKDITVYPAGILPATTILVSSFLNHRLNFDNPNEFDPDRFLNKIDSYTLTPFGPGDASNKFHCLGPPYAKRVIKSVLIHQILNNEVHITTPLEKNFDRKDKLHLLGTPRYAEKVFAFFKPSTTKNFSAARGELFHLCP